MSKAIDLVIDRFITKQHSASVTQNLIITGDTLDKTLVSSTINRSQTANSVEIYVQNHTHPHLVYNQTLVIPT